MSTQHIIPSLNHEQRNFWRFEELCDCLFYDSFQVTKNKRWEEVAVALKLEGLKMKYPYQLQQVYALFLFQFEQIYFYRAPEKKAADPGMQSYGSFYLEEVLVAYIFIYNTTCTSIETIC